MFRVFFFLNDYTLPTSNLLVAVTHRLSTKMDKKNWFSRLCELSFVTLLVLLMRNSEETAVWPSWYLADNWDITWLAERRLRCDWLRDYYTLVLLMFLTLLTAAVRAWWDFCGNKITKLKTVALMWEKSDWLSLLYLVVIIQSKYKLHWRWRKWDSW